MDAYGNLTDISEFSGGRRIRLISYMGEDLALGGFPAEPAPFGSANAGIHHVSAGNPDQTIFIAETSTNIWTAPAGTFFLEWAIRPGANGLHLAMEVDAIAGMVVRPLETNPFGGQVPPAPTLTVEFVDGCWLALNNATRDHVADSRESGTDEGNPVIPFAWNGGANQIWRAATRGPGLG